MLTFVFHFKIYQFCQNKNLIFFYTFKSNSLKNSSFASSGATLSIPEYSTPNNSFIKKLNPESGGVTPLTLTSVWCEPHSQRT